MLEVSASLALVATMTRPARPRIERTNTAVRFPPAVHERLQEAADERGLTMNYLVVKAVEEFLDHLIPADEIRFTR